MAIQLSIEFGQSGHLANYWRILSFDVSAVERSISVRVGLFKDEAAYLGGKRPLLTKLIYLNGARSPVGLSRLVSIEADLQSAILQDPIFAGGVEIPNQ